jgi:Mor family transcriptional regulator
MQRVIREISEVVGLADAIELVRRWGGRELYVPVKVERADALALTLGLDAARRLVQHYGGQRLQLPAERNALLDLRNAAIVAQHDGGASMETIGLQYGLTRQAVSHILRTIREREAVRQKFAGRSSTNPAAKLPANI